MRHRFTARITLGLVALLAPLAFALTAHAGPVEQLVQVAFHPKDPKTMAVRYIWGGEGLIITRDGGTSWQLLCNSATMQLAQATATDPTNFDPVTTHMQSAAIAADGTGLIGVFSGLLYDDQHSCGWQSLTKYEGEFISTFAVDALDPNIVYAATSTAQGGDTKPNGLLRRDASGAWTEYGTRDKLLITSVFLAKLGSGERIYMSGVRGQIQPDDGGTPLPNYVIRYSDDNGASWTENVFGTTDGQLRLQGVDPTNPDRVIVTINRAEDINATRAEMDDSVLVSSDRGKTFKTYMTVTDIGGVAFAPDGRVWIGDLGTISDPTAPQGLHFAPSLDKPATKLSNGDYPVQCLAYQAASDTLYACQHWWFGPIDPKDGTFTSQLNLTQVGSMVECPGKNMASLCQTQLCQAWCGLNHFAEAPVCEAYTTPTCGPAAADPNAAKKAGTGGTAAGGQGGHGGAAGSAGTVGGVGGQGGMGGQAGTSGGANGKKSGGCCSVAVGSRSNGPAALGLLFALALVRVVRRTRKRAG